MIKRRSRSGGQDVCLAFACSEETVRFETSREGFLGRGGLLNLKNALANGGSGEKNGARGTFAPDACVAARIRLSLPAGQEIKIRFSLSFAQGEADAAAAAQRTLKFVSPQCLSRLDGTARILGLTGGDIAQAMDYLSRLRFPCLSEKKREGGGPLSPLGPPGLWQFGISGDLPIMLMRPGTEDPEKALSRMLRQHRLLALNGFACELVLYLSDGADYRRPCTGPRCIR
jgi:hypothetical protein